jgi:hypothetical protein
MVHLTTISALMIPRIYFAYSTYDNKIVPFDFLHIFQAGEVAL